MRIVHACTYVYVSTSKYDAEFDGGESLGPFRARNHREMTSLERRLRMGICTTIVFKLEAVAPFLSFFETIFLSLRKGCESMVKEIEQENV